MNSTGDNTRLARAARMTWALGSLIVVQAIVCGVSLLPVAVLWYGLERLAGSNAIARLVAFSLALMPSYVLFALSLMIVSPLALRLLGWRTPADAAMRIADVEWPLLSWVRYGASIHLVRVVAGPLFRATPIWTLHLRLGGARLGKRVYVNSLGVSDYNLLACGHDVVIGASVHLSGHTVERGVLKTAHVRLGDNVTIGIGTVVEIDVEIGANAQIGAMSFVPKHARLPGGMTYVGVPVAPIQK